MTARGGHILFVAIDFLAFLVTLLGFHRQRRCLLYTSLPAGNRSDGNWFRAPACAATLSARLNTFSPAEHFQPGLIPAAFMIGSSRASSLARKAFISAGEVGIGDAPRSA